MNQKTSNEITIKIKCQLNEFYKIIEEKGFKKIRQFSMDDTYFIPKEIELDKLSTRDILSKAVLVRDIIGNIYKMEYKISIDEFMKKFYISDKTKNSIIL